MKAYAHIEYMNYVLGLLNHSFPNVLALMRSNYSTNMSFANKIPVDYLKSVLHQFNIAFKDVFMDSYAFIKNSIGHEALNRMGLQNKSTCVARTFKS